MRLVDSLVEVMFRMLSSWVISWSMVVRLVLSVARRVDTFLSSAISLFVFMVVL